MVKHPPERATVDFWHRFPSDDAWRQVTLAGHERLGFGLQPMCNACQHQGEVFTPTAFSERYGIPMDEPLLLVQRRLRCTTCRLPAGYFYLHNPSIRPAGTYPTR